MNLAIDLTFAGLAVLSLVVVALTCGERLHVPGVESSRLDETDRS